MTREKFIPVISVEVALPSPAQFDELIRVFERARAQLNRTAPACSNAVVIFEFSGPVRARLAIPVDPQGQLQLSDAPESTIIADENLARAEAEARRIAQTSAKAVDIGNELARALAKNQYDLDMFQDIAAKSPDEPVTVRTYLDARRKSQTLNYPDRNRTVGGGHPTPTLLVADHEFTLRCLIVGLDGDTLQIEVEKLPRLIDEAYIFAKTKIPLLAHGRAGDILRSLVGSRIEADVVVKPARELAGRGQQTYCLLLVRLGDPPLLLKELAEYLIQCERELPE
jgi:hypothetical protein